MSLTKRPRTEIQDNDEEPSSKKIKTNETEEEQEPENSPDPPTEENDDEDEDDDIAKLYCVSKNMSDLGADEWKLDDNNDKIHKFFQNNSMLGKDNWPDSESFKVARRIAQNLEKLMNGVTKQSAKATKWFGFVLVPAFEDQEDQNAFEEALGLPSEILEAEAGLYYEDVEDDAELFVQEDEELSSIPKDASKKMKEAKDMIHEFLDDYFTVSFLSEVETCLFPEFWGGHTEDGILVGLVATIHPVAFDE